MSIGPSAFGVRERSRPGQEGPMGNTGTALLAGAIALIFVLIAIGGFLAGTVHSFHEAITSDEVWSGNITTGLGVTTGDFVLDQPLYNSELAGVVSMASNNGNDTPFASVYNTGTNTLTIGGLAQSDNRVITTTYKYDDTTTYPSSKQVLQIGPTFVAICLIAMLILIPVGMGIIVYARIKK